MAFNQFLCTPAGQQLASANQAIISKILDHLGVHLAPNPAQVALAEKPV